MRISFRRLPVLLALFAIVLSIPLTVYLARQQQELRERAAEVSPLSLSLYFTRTSCSNPPLNSLSLIPGQQVFLLLCLNAQHTNVSGFDITTISSASLTFGATTEGTDSQKFEVLIFNNRQQNGWRFTKVNTTIGETIAGILYLATVRFDASQVLGSGTLRFQSFMVTSPTSPGPLSVTPANLTYAIIQPTPTPTRAPSIPPTRTPTPTLTPPPVPSRTPTSTPTPTGGLTPIPTPTPTRGVTPTPTTPPRVTPTPTPTNPPPAGEYGDNTINIRDYNTFVSCFRKTVAEVPNCEAADLNDDGVVDSSDFLLLFDSFQTQYGD